MVSRDIHDLEGPALDWAVAMALKFAQVKIGEAFGRPVVTVSTDPDPKTATFIWFRPSTDWFDGGPILFAQKASIGHHGENDLEDYTTEEEPVYSDCGNAWAIGKTPLIAAMRAICIYHNEYEHMIEIPEGLA